MGTFIPKIQLSENKQTETAGTKQNVSKVKYSVHEFLFVVCRTLSLLLIALLEKMHTFFKKDDNKQ